MKRINRVRSSKDFKEIISNRITASNDSFQLFFKINNLDYTRIGISVSKKLGNAVVRTRIKRQVRAMINEIMKLSKKIDIVIIVRQSFINKTYVENREALSKLLSEYEEKNN